MADIYSGCEQQIDSSDHSSLELDDLAADARGSTLGHSDSRCPPASICGHLPNCHVAAVLTTHLANVDLCAQRVDDLFDDIAVAASALVMNLLQGVMGAQLHTGPDHSPQLVCHLSISPLQARLIN